MHGPHVLAGLCDAEPALLGDRNDPSSLMRPDHSWQWGDWVPSFTTYGQERNVRFVPLHRVIDEPCTVYFTVMPRNG